MRCAAFLLLPWIALAAPLAYGSNKTRVHFAVTANAQVVSDETRATLSKSASAPDPKSLAEALNPIARQALRVAQQHPNVTVATDSQYAHPRYNDEGEIVGVTGAVSLRLTSRDNESLAALIEQLQDTLALESVAFGVSEPLRQTTQQRLMLQATQRFQEQAQTIAKAWGADGYRLLEAHMDADGRSGALGASFDAQALRSGAPALQAQEKTLSYTVSGSIELQYNERQ